MNQQTLWPPPPHSSCYPIHTVLPLPSHLPGGPHITQFSSENILLKTSKRQARLEIRSGRKTKKAKQKTDSKSPNRISSSDSSDSVIFFFPKDFEKIKSFRSSFDFINSTSNLYLTPKVKKTSLRNPDSWSLRRFTVTLLATPKNPSILFFSPLCLSFFLCFVFDRQVSVIFCLIFRYLLCRLRLFSGSSSRNDPELIDITPSASSQGPRSSKRKQNQVRLQSEILIDQ